MDSDIARGEIVHQGWLTKSPPLETKKQIFRALIPKWRRRWFVLREGGVPGQYLLYYYSDSSAKKLKGVIDLDCLEQVDSGLTFESGKVKYQHMFDIKTPKRVYYLAADTEQAMSEWVDCVCQVCGLRPYQDQEQAVEDQQLQQQPVMTSQPTAAISGPYMHLSECFTGGGRVPAECHVRSRTLSRQQRSASPAYQNNPPIAGNHFSGGDDGGADEETMLGDDSVFLPSSPPAKAAACGGRTLTSSSSIATDLPSGDHLSGSSGLFAKLKVSEVPAGPVPGRPPKPPGLRNQHANNYPSQPAGDTYANHEDMQRVALISKTEAAVLGLHEKNNNNTTSQHQQQQFINQHHQHLSINHHPDSLHHLQKQQQQAPQIDRRLKPFRKDSLSEATTMPSTARTTSTAAPMGGNSGPPVERRLKPRSGSADLAAGDGGAHFSSVLRQYHQQSDGGDGGPFSRGLQQPGSGFSSSGLVHPLAGRFRRGESDDSLSDFDSRRSSVEEEQIYYYMPSLQQCQTGGPPIMIPAREIHNRIQYLDLDLPEVSGNSTTAAAGNSLFMEEDPQQQHLHSTVEANRTRDTETVYKMVDFIRTEAFNRTRMKVEENRSKMTQD